jgi:transcriptional regulator with XRE-family HTH domain
VSNRRSLRILTAHQARAARAVLGLSVERLAKISDVSASSIRRIERVQNGTTITLDLAVKLQRFFEQEGMRFYYGTDDSGVTWSDKAIH